MTRLNGMALCAAGIVLMCAMDAVAKALGAHLSTFQVVFLRYLGAAIWLALWIGITRGGWPQRSWWSPPPSSFTPSPICRWRWWLRSA